MATREQLGWTELDSSALSEWNRRLLATRTSLFQYPYWNEALRRRGVVPRYLVLGASREPRAWACVLTVGVPGARVGLVQRGPVALDGDDVCAAGDIQSLCRWARRRGYAFLRFTHSDARQLEQVEAAGGVRGEDVFPFYREPQEELLVSQVGSDETILGSFQAVARRNIRGALKAGYQIVSGDSPEMLRGLWPLFQQLSDRKGFSFRPLESYLALLEQARPYGAARLYSALLGDRAVQALIVVRDGHTAHYVSGALDMAAIGDLESPSALLHWHAMRDFARDGVTYYNLGTRSGVVHRFKLKFRPVERRNPPAAIVVTNPVAFWLWTRAGMKLLRAVWPLLKRQLARARRHAGAG